MQVFKVAVLSYVISTVGYAHAGVLGRILKAPQNACQTFFTNHRQVHARLPKSLRAVPAMRFYEPYFAGEGTWVRAGNLWLSNRGDVSWRIDVDGDRATVVVPLLNGRRDFIVIARVLAAAATKVVDEGHPLDGLSAAIINGESALRIDVPLEIRGMKLLIYATTPLITWLREATSEGALVAPPAPYDKPIPFPTIHADPSLDAAALSQQRAESRAEAVHWVHHNVDVRLYYLQMYPHLLMDPPKPLGDEAAAAAADETARLRRGDTVPSELARLLPQDRMLPAAELILSSLGEWTREGEAWTASRGRVHVTINNGRLILTLRGERAERDVQRVVFAALATAKRGVRLESLIGMSRRDDGIEVTLPLNSRGLRVLIPIKRQIDDPSLGFADIVGAEPGPAVLASVREWLNGQSMGWIEAQLPQAAE